MSFFNRKKENSPAFRRKMAQNLHGKYLKYVTERLPDGESVIARGGALIYRDGHLMVSGNPDIVFRCRAEELDMAELLSKEGVILTGRDSAHGHAMRTVIAYYTYYRRVDN